jgi:Leucine-rich repeat (LRR) protein
MKRILILLILATSVNFGFSQDKLGFGNMPDGVDSAGFGTVTTWVKPSNAITIITMSTTSTSETWSPQVVTKTGAILHWEVSGAASYSVDINDPTFDFSAEGTKNIIVTSSDGGGGLTALSCYYNNLTELDVSGCVSLQVLSCSANGLTSLNVTGCISLSILYSNTNNLTELDVSGCVSLNDLQCDYNRLVSLNIDGCFGLQAVRLTSNNLSSQSLLMLFDYLIANTVGNFVNVRAQAGGGCVTQTKINELDAIWNIIFADVC